jgi:hypothetical protein
MISAQASRPLQSEPLVVLKALIGMKKKFLNLRTKFVQGLLEGLYRRAAGRSSVLLLRDLQFFTQDHGFPRGPDAYLGALLRDSQKFDLNLIADQNAFTRAASQH